MSVSEAKQTLQFEGGVLLGRQEAALARGALLFLRDGQVVKRMLITITLKPVFPLPTWLLAWTVSFRPADRRFFCRISGGWRRAGYRRHRCSAQRGCPNFET